MAGTDNTERMTLLDQAWNAQDWDTFERFHSQDTQVYWPAQPGPTRGRADHKAESVQFFKTFPDNHLELPYKVLFGEGDMTCSVARFTGTMTGPMKNPDGTETPPTNRSSKSSSAPGRRNRRGEVVLGRGRADEADRRDVAGTGTHAFLGVIVPAPRRRH